MLFTLLSLRYTIGNKTGIQYTLGRTVEETTGDFVGNTKKLWKDTSLIQAPP